MRLGAPHLTLGTKLRDGKYTVGAVLGQGGFGITYLGADTKLNRAVAIKELFPEGSARHNTHLWPPTSLGTTGFPQLVDAFLAEARMLARFDHPSIVKIWDAFQENNTAYLVMEALKGRPLSEYVRQNGSVPSHGLQRIAAAICGALVELHAADILHRDIKPDNVFMTDSGRIVLIDFGSARTFQSNRTVRHTRMVTHGYAPLEQYASEGKFGPPIDLYAVAGTLYFAATGSPPPNAVDRQIGTPLSPLPTDLPGELRDAIQRGLEVEIRKRPQTAKQFLGLLQQRVGTAGEPIGRPRATANTPQAQASAPTAPPGPAIPTIPHSGTWTRESEWEDAWKRTNDKNESDTGEDANFDAAIGCVGIVIIGGLVLAFPVVMIPLLILAWIAHAFSK